MASRLSAFERARIEAMTKTGMRAPAVARALGRNRAAAHRELKRGGGPGGYDAGQAQESARRRAARPKVPKLVADPELAADVEGRMKLRWSPQTVAADLRERGKKICAETIYQACYDTRAASGLRADCWRLLPRCRRLRKPRGRRTRNSSPPG